MNYDGLIVGLGNPGVQYARTRHNFGFMLVDRLVRFAEAEPGWSSELRRLKVNAEIWDVNEDFGSRRWLVTKPLTFMNLSGQVVGELCRKNAISPERVIVLHDELDLPLGTVRLKFSGGLAGHNGLKSIAAHLGTRDFSRLRLGIDRPVGGGPVADYVLRPFLPTEWDKAMVSLDLGLEALLNYCREGLAVATTRLHSK